MVAEIPYASQPWQRYPHSTIKWTPLPNSALIAAAYLENPTSEGSTTAKNSPAAPHPVGQSVIEGEFLGAHPLLDCISIASQLTRLTNPAASGLGGSCLVATCWLAIASCCNGWYFPCVDHHLCLHVKTQNQSLGRGPSLYCRQLPLMVTRGLAFHLPRQHGQQVACHCL